MINNLSRPIPIVGEDGRMNELSYQWMLGVTNLQTIVGLGSPEGVIEAGVTKFFLQTDGAPQQKLWVKVLTDIAGDRSMGWELV